jgi:peptidoglycan/xylan/chitin deacetylase (PgdA/CDA1 family)
MLSLPYFPIIPTVYPNDINTQFQENLIEYTNFVESVVPWDLLSIPLATYNKQNPAAPVYNGKANETCYWPSTDCIQKTVIKYNQSFSEYIEPDLYTCPFNVHGLSYDDGPSEFTPELLETLSSENIKATFFIVGKNAVKYPEIIKQIHDEGHEIGIHTWGHFPMTTLSTSEIVAELIYTQSLVYSITGKVINTFRPPYGDIDNRVRAIASALGFYTVMWNRDSYDTSASVSEFSKTTKSWIKKPQPGFITLQHDMDKVTVEYAKSALRQRKVASGSKTITSPISECNGKLWYTSYRVIPKGFNKTEYDSSYFRERSGLGNGNILTGETAGWSDSVSESGSLSRFSVWGIIMVMVMW